MWGKQEWINVYPRTLFISLGMEEPGHRESLITCLSEQRNYSNECCPNWTNWKCSKHRLKRRFSSQLTFSRICPLFKKHAIALHRSIPIQFSCYSSWLLWFRFDKFNIYSFDHIEIVGVQWLVSILDILNPLISLLICKRPRSI